MIYILSAIILLLFIVIIWNSWKHNKQVDSLLNYQVDVYEKWHVERQLLLDRIQAPSFDHLKQAEIRNIRAQKEEPPVKYELV